MNSSEQVNVLSEMTHDFKKPEAPPPTIRRESSTLPHEEAAYSQHYQ